MRVFSIESQGVWTTRPPELSPASRVAMAVLFVVLFGIGAWGTAIQAAKHAETTAGFHIQP